MKDYITRKIKSKRKDKYMIIVEDDVIFEPDLYNKINFQIV